MSWARRFEHGQVHLEGRLTAPLRVGEGELSAGPVALEVEFEGGQPPTLVRAVAIAHQVRAGGVVRLPLDASGLEAVVGQLWDLRVQASARARGNVHLRFGPGVELDFPGGTVQMTGEASGPPHAMVLCAPLEIRAGQATVRLAGSGKLRWLSELAAIRVDRAVLHPDGRVALEGGARRGLDRAVRSGLRRASDAVSSLVRHSPRFRVVRTFLPA